MLAICDIVNLDINFICKHAKHMKTTLTFIDAASLLTLAFEMLSFIPELRVAY